MNIVKEIMPRGIKVLIYGVEGVGKTTLATDFPKPLIFNLDRGADFMEVAKVSGISSIKTLYDYIDEFAKSEYETLVIDTADKIEELFVRELCRKYGKEGLEAFGYGQGITYLKEEMEKLLDFLTAVVTLGKHVVILAHSRIESVKDPRFEAEYNRYTLKLETKGAKQVGAVFKEWADLMLFCDFETFVKTDKNGAKGTAYGKNKRVMYTERTASYEAKNRFNLESMYDLDFKHIAHLFKAKMILPPTPPVVEQKEEPTKKKDEKRELVDDLLELFKKKKVKEKEILFIIGENGLKFTKHYSSLSECTLKDLKDIKEEIEYLVTEVKKKEWQEAYQKFLDKDIELPFDI